MYQYHMSIINISIRLFEWFLSESNVVASVVLKVKKSWTYTNMQTKCIVKYKLQYNKWAKYSGLTGCSWNRLLFVLFKNGRDDHVMMTPTKNMSSPVDSSLHKEVFGVISGTGETQRPLSDSFTETSSLFVPIEIPLDYYVLCQALQS